MIAESGQKQAKIIDRIEKHKIFAVVRTDSRQKAEDISKALIEGGIKTVEITMSFENAHKAIENISKIEGVSVAAGCVITSMQADSAISAGAQLIVSPVSEMRVIKLCRSRQIRIVTGAATPNEAYNAWKLGVNIIKIFPAKALGGPEYIKDILTPMPFLHLMPTGGVSIDDFTDYLDSGAVAVGIGNDFYAEEADYTSITKKARLATLRLEKYLENK